MGGKTLRQQTKGAISIKELTSKERLFCTYYSLNRNPREAAVKSGYLFPEKSALRLLKKQEVNEEIARIDKQRRATDNDVALGFARLAFGCVSDAIALMFKDEVSESDIEKMDLFNIAEIKRKKGGDIEIKFFDRLKALQSLTDVTAHSSEKESSIFSAIEKGALALSDEKRE